MENSIDNNSFDNKNPTSENSANQVNPAPQTEVRTAINNATAEPAAQPQVQQRITYNSAQPNQPRPAQPMQSQPAANLRTPPQRPPYNPAVNPQQPNNPVAPNRTLAYNTPHYTPAQQKNAVYANRVPPSPKPSPATVYNNTCKTTAPQYHYGNSTPGQVINNAYYQEQIEKRNKEREETKKIRTIGNLSGLTVIIVYAIMNVLSVFIAIANLVSSDFANFMATTSGQSLFNLLFSIVAIGGTFLIFKQKLQDVWDKKTGLFKYNVEINYTAPKSPLKSILLIFISFGGCMVAQYIVFLIQLLFSLFNVSFTPDITYPYNDISDVIVLCIGLAVVPPLIEEFAMRGLLLSLTKKYGNAFAIISTAFIFGLFHGNFAQIPFAFICGLFFAYSVIATKSLWTGIIIHAMNNGIACIQQILYWNYDDTVANNFFYIISAVGIVLGVVALIIYIRLFKNQRILRDHGEITDFSTSVKFRKFMSSPGMIIATILYLGEALLLALISSIPAVASLY